MTLLFIYRRAKFIKCFSDAYPKFKPTPLNKGNKKNSGY